MRLSVLTESKIEDNLQILLKQSRVVNLLV
jgi:hypothetical protein